MCDEMRAAGERERRSRTVLWRVVERGHTEHLPAHLFRRAVLVPHLNATHPCLSASVTLPDLSRAVDITLK
jgi:hypothetical protein